MIKTGRFTLPTTWLVALSGMVVVSLVGWLCFYLSFGQGLALSSYDLPFLWRGNLTTSDVCLVVIDEKSAAALHQPLDAPWDRRLHTRLVDTLTRLGARAILFDVVFETPGADPKIDQDFARALSANGKVFLGAGLLSDPGRNVDEEKLLAPIPELRRAAAGWGLLVLKPVDPDFGVRQIYTGGDVAPSATWVMARALGAPLPEDPGTNEFRWINYYGPAGRMASVGYDEALQPETLAPDFFKDKIVVVGGRQKTVGNYNQQRDLFFSPYTHVGQPFNSGMEIHATILLNLLRHQWLERLSPVIEGWGIVLYGCSLVLVLTFVCSFCPFRATGTAIVAAFLVAFAAGEIVWHEHVWFAWLVPAVVQTPLALFWGLGANYLIETRRRALVTRAISLYVSPEMAREIAAMRFDLKPGGKMVEATMMFTDLQGFTSLSEQISDPLQIADVMITYFNNTTRHVLDNRGLISKYMGDAVFAVWGSLLPDDDHAYHAAVAAWGMHQYSKLNVHGHHLVTRIGLNTGRVVAGNLGSDFRFDWTCIGDPVNLASRLEGLNKYLGTQVLMTDATLQHLKGRFVARRLGQFILLGKTEPVIIHELLGPAVTGDIQAKNELFVEALAAYEAGDLAKAQALFEKTLAKHHGIDGPCEFYLKQIAKLKAAGLPGEWTGVNLIDAK